MKRLCKNFLVLFTLVSCLFFCPARAYAISPEAAEFLVSMVTTVVKAAGADVASGGWDVVTTAYGFYTKSQYLSFIESKVLSMNEYQLGFLAELLDAGYPQYDIVEMVNETQPVVPGYQPTVITYWFMNSPSGTVSIRISKANASKVATFLCRWIDFICQAEGYDFPTESNPVTGELDGSGGGGSGSIVVNANPLLPDGFGNVTQSEEDNSLDVVTYLRWVVGSYTDPATISTAGEGASYMLVSGKNKSFFVDFSNSTYWSNIRDRVGNYPYHVFLMAPVGYSGLGSTIANARPNGIAGRMLLSNSPITVTVNPSGTDVNGDQRYNVSVSGESDIIVMGSSLYSLGSTSNIAINDAGVSLSWTNSYYSVSYNLGTSGVVWSYARGLWADWPGISSGAPVVDDGTPSWSDTTGVTGAWDTVIDYLDAINTNIVNFLQSINDNITALGKYLNGVLDDILGEIQNFEDLVASGGSSGSGYFDYGIDPNGDYSDFNLEPLDEISRSSVSLLRTKFPFSLPWDVRQLINMWAVPAQAPDCTIVIPLSETGLGLNDMSFGFDLSDDEWSWLGQLSRMASRCLFVASMIPFTRKMLQVAKPISVVTEAG